MIFLEEAKYYLLNIPSILLLLLKSKIILTRAKNQQYSTI